MTKVLAGLTLPADGTVTRSGTIGYLPQDPKVDDMSQLARDRILSARTGRCGAQDASGAERYG